jgi:hypothetical protein
VDDAPEIAILCYVKNVKADLTADEKKQLRQIAVHLKGAQ